jgi:hypothetical protein
MAAKVKIAGCRRSAVTAKRVIKALGKVVIFLIVPPTLNGNSVLLVACPVHHARKHAVTIKRHLLYSLILTCHSALDAESRLFNKKGGISTAVVLFY